ncbi:TBC1 domain family member 17 [Fasciola hepatica]|uniref:TBC1 domain family member 17 n=1 Tax=Fasciola hepatica TaxID=6192 RepID=A0A4E0QVG4_FASHE|nr:TBC1 domain family member 17 [Fasciola hepatica]
MTTDTLRDFCFTHSWYFLIQGIESSLRPVVWKYLLGYYLWDNTAAENEKRRIEKHREYHMLKKFWKEMSIERLDRFSLFRDRKCFIEKDVPRTDRRCDFYRDDSDRNLTRLYDILLTYAVYNMDFGYFQGMNDLLALILYVIQSEEESFWCFVGLMERLESNFDGNLNAVRQQFYQLFELLEVLNPTFSDYLEAANAKEMPFCFRWLLIQFKREFSYTDVMVLWEAIWSEHLTKNFHIFFAAAILLMHSELIMEQKLDANSILKLVNDMSNKIPLEPVLIAATQYVEQLNKILPDLPKAVQDLINGPSLATSQHTLRRKSGVDPEDVSSRLDYTSELLNEELEDLMGTEATDSSLMVPIP